MLAPFSRLSCVQRKQKKRRGKRKIEGKREGKKKIQERNREKERGLGFAKECKSETGHEYSNARSLRPFASTSYDPETNVIRPFSYQWRYKDTRWLLAGSRLSFACVYSSRNRRTEARGEPRFSPVDAFRDNRTAAATRCVRQVVICTFKRRCIATNLTFAADTYIFLYIIIFLPFSFTNLLRVFSLYLVTCISLGGNDRGKVSLRGNVVERVRFPIVDRLSIKIAIWNRVRARLQRRRK